MKVEIQLDDPIGARAWARNVTNNFQAGPTVKALAYALLAQLADVACGDRLTVTDRELSIGPTGHQFHYECTLPDGHSGDHHWRSPYRPDVSIQWSEPEHPEEAA